MDFLYNILHACAQESKDIGNNDFATAMIKCKRKKQRVAAQLDFRKEFLETQDFRNALDKLDFYTKPEQMMKCKEIFQENIYNEIMSASNKVDQCFYNHKRES